MKNYLNFINEKYIEELSIDEFDKLFKTSPLYNKMITTDEKDLTLIYREVKGNDYRGDFNNYYGFYNVLDPKEIERVSPNTKNNLYNLFFSNSERWSEYPKRNKSLICGDSVAVDRRGCNPHNKMIVIPLEHIKIGVCSDDDIWSSFYESIKNTSYISGFFHSLKYDYYRTTGFVDDIDDKNWDNLVNDLNKFDKNRKIDVILSIKDMIKDDVLSDKWSKKEISTMELLDEIFDPKKNDFSLIDYDGTNLPSSREVWTDSKCLLVRNDVFFNFLQFHTSF